MAKKPLPRFQTGAALRALFLGATLAVAAPVLADNLPEVQKLIKQAQFPQALSKVDAYLAGKPKDAQGRFLKGLILTEMNRPAEAIAVFTKLTEDYPELPEPYNNLAVLYAQQKQYEKARLALEMAIRTHPAYAIAYENMGDVYAKLASQAYDKALQIDSSNAAAQNKLALIRDLITTSGKTPVRPPAALARPEAPAAVPAVAAVTPPPAAKPAAPAAPVTQPAPTVKPITPPAATVAVTPVATPPTAKPVTSEAATAPGNADVRKALENWAAAWSRKDIKSYLAAYSPEFKLPKGMSRKAWEKQREDRIAGKGGKISVTYDEPSISLQGDKATIKFRQHYKARGLSSSTNKQLLLHKSGGKWLILEENTR